MILTQPVKNWKWITVLSVTGGYIIKRKTIMIKSPKKKSSEIRPQMRMMTKLQTFIRFFIFSQFD